MRRSRYARAPRRLRLAILCAVAVLACDGGGTGPTPNPEPIVETTTPTLLTRAPDGAVVDVLGLGFVESSEVLWNGELRPTIFVAGTHLTVELTAQDLAAASGEISVLSPPPGGGTSAPVTLLVAHPAPALTSVSPTSAPAVVTSDLTLVLQGSAFVTTDPGARALWDAVPLSTTVVSSTELSAVVPDYLLQVGRSAQIRVRNPGPGGGESNPVAFGVENPVPVISGTDPVGVNAGVTTELDILGTGFVYGASVSFEGTPLTPIWSSASRLTVAVPGALAVGGETPSVRVENPGPGGGISNALQLVVYVAPPIIDAIFPSRVFAGSPDFTLVIAGADFDPAASVTWNGSPRASTFVGSGRLELGVPASDVAVAGPVEIRVTNPAAGGVASADFEIIDAPVSGSVLLSGRTGGGELVLSEPDGTEILTVSVSGAYQVEASPVSSHAAYYKGGRIHELDPFTGVERRVTASAEEAQFSEEQWPRYSADGQWIYYKAKHFSGRWELWRSPTAGGPAEKLLSSETETYGYPTPSHRGDRVVYSNGVSEGQTRLWILDLTTRSTTPLGVDGALSRWTPDDEWIVYTNWGELRAVRPDGSGDFAIAPSVSFAGGFDVSPDGSSIVAASQDWSRGYLISFPAGTVQVLTPLGAVRSMAWYGP